MEALLPSSADLRYLMPMPPILRVIALAGLVAWLLTGLTQVPLDKRAIYERFGAPMSVLHPGLHAGLPWPLATTHMLDDGAIRDMALSATTSQGVTAGLQILYRIGPADADALRSIAIADPDALVRALATGILTQYAATQPIDAASGHTLRTRLQDALDRHATGLEALGITVNATLPPAESAGADIVRAADIAARADIAVAHGAAATLAAQSRQSAYDMTSTAHAAAAENVARAGAELVRFAADRQAARAGGQSFLLERYLTALGTALAHAPKTIIDHRLNWPEAPVLDLRPYAPAEDAATGKQE